jgi:hypothetical protein
MAHLADWDGVFLKRAQATLKGEATVDDPDGVKVAAERKYEFIDPHESIRRYSVVRYQLLQLFKGLKAADWEKTTTHPRHGAMSLEVQAVHVLGHDGYHLDAITSMMALAGLAEAGLAEPATDGLGLEN